MEFHEYWRLIAADPTKTLGVFLLVLWTTITILLLTIRSHNGSHPRKT